MSISLIGLIVFDLIIGYDNSHDYDDDENVDIDGDDDVVDDHDDDDHDDENCDNDNYDDHDHDDAIDDYNSPANNDINIISISIKTTTIPITPT